jgi:hypothetical protein
MFYSDQLDTLLNKKDMYVEELLDIINNSHKSDLFGWVFYFLDKFKNIIDTLGPEQ